MGEVAGVATGAGTAGQLLLQALAPAPQPAQHARPLAIQAASNVGRAGRQAGVPGSVRLAPLLLHLALGQVVLQRVHRQLRHGLLQRLAVVPAHRG